MKRCALLISFGLVAGFVTDAAALTNNFVVTRKTEHKIGEFYGIGGAKFCVWAYKLGTREPSSVSVRRSLNGRSKFLARIRGKHCWKSKAGVYIVYAAADKVDLRVYFEEPGGRPPRPPLPPIFDPPT